MLLLVPINFPAMSLIEACITDFDTYSTAHQTGIMALKPTLYQEQKSQKAVDDICQDC